MTTAPQPQIASPVAGNATIKVFGVGHAGVRVLEETLALGVPDASFVAVNSDARALAACRVAAKVLCNRQPLAYAREGLASTDFGRGRDVPAPGAIASAPEGFASAESNGL